MSHLHLPDGILPWWLVGLGWMLALAWVTISSRFVAPAEARRRIPLVGAVSALTLVAMSSEIVPIAYHVNLSVLAGVMLGAWLSPLAAIVVVTALALMGHGGITVVGLNMLVIACEMVAGNLLFRLLVRLAGRQRSRIAAFVATMTTLAVSTTAVIGIVALSGIGGTAESARLEIPRFAGTIYALGSVGWLLESALTAWIIGFAARVRPALVFADSADAPHLPGDESAHR